MSCLKRMKNAVLRTITTVAGMMTALGIISLDSKSIVIPMLMIGIGGGWLTLFYFANNEYFARRHM